MRTRFIFDTHKMRPLIMAIVVEPMEHVGSDLQHYAIAVDEYAGMCHRHAGQEGKPRSRARQGDCNPRHETIWLAGRVGFFIKRVTAIVC